MNLNDLKKNWNQFGEDDPYWAILTDPDKKNNGWKEDDFFKSGEKQINRIIRSIKNLEPNAKYGTALDFGCGAGRLSQGLSFHFDEVVGLDIAPSMIQLAKDKNKKENCSFLINDKNDLTIFNDEKFDFIYSIITLQHMQPKYALNYIKEFLRVLKFGGVVVFQIPSRLTHETFKDRLATNNIVGKILKLREPKPDKNAPPRMEMYGIPIEKLIPIIVRNSGQILKIQKDDKVGDDWTSYTYIVRKSI